MGGAGRAVDGTLNTEEIGTEQYGTPHGCLLELLNATEGWVHEGRQSPYRLHMHSACGVLTMAWPVRIRCHSLRTEGQTLGKRSDMDWKAGSARAAGRRSVVGKWRPC